VPNEVEQLVTRGSRWVKRNSANRSACRGPLVRWEQAVLAAAKCAVHERAAVSADHELFYASYFFLLRDDCRVGSHFCPKPEQFFHYVSVSSSFFTLLHDYIFVRRCGPRVFFPGDSPVIKLPVEVQATGVVDYTPMRFQSGRVT